MVLLPWRDQMKAVFCALTVAEYSALVNLEVDIGLINDPVVRKRLLQVMHDIWELGMNGASDLCRDSLKERSPFSSFLPGE